MNSNKEIGQKINLYLYFIDQPNQMQGGFGQAYKIGVDKFYTQKGSQYHNPHQYDIQRFLKKRFSKQNPYINKQSKILDLACGAGQVTLALRGIGYKHFAGIDPYTYKVYQQKTGLKCEKFTFVDIVNGALEGQKYDAIIISYALHLVKETMLYDFCRNLVEVSSTLIVVAPHKFPIMKDHYGWKQVQSTVQDKIHLRIFKSFESLQQQQKEEASKKEKTQPTSN